MKPTIVAPEREIQAAVLDALTRVFKLDVQRQNTGMGSYTGADGATRKVRFGKAGNADLSGTLPDGRRLEIEVKRPGKKPTPKQLERIRSVNRSRGVAFWVNDVDQIMRVIPALMMGCWIVEERGEFYVTDGQD